MKKQHTFKNYMVDGLEDTYTIRVKLANEWTLLIELDGVITKYELEDQTFGITKEEALNYIEAFMADTMELEMI